MIRVKAHLRVGGRGGVTGGLSRGLSAPQLNAVLIKKLIEKLK